MSGGRQPETGRMALIPAKVLPEAKSRLGAVLSPRARAALSLGMLTDVVDAVLASGCFGQVGVLTRDEEAAAWAARRGADVLWETGPPGLNAALRQGMALALARGVRELLIVLADLPLVQAADIQALVAAAGAGEAAPPGTVVVAPSQDGGTSALLLRPPAAVPPSFGEASAARHALAAAEAGLAVHWCRRAGLARDIDREPDLRFLAAHGEGTHAWRALQASGCL